MPDSVESIRARLADLTTSRDHLRTELATLHRQIDEKGRAVKALNYRIERGLEEFSRAVAAQDVRA